MGYRFEDAAEKKQSVDPPHDPFQEYRGHSLIKKSVASKDPLVEAFADALNDRLGLNKPTYSPQRGYYDTRDHY